MERRRRVSRQPAGWAGMCRIDGESVVRWHDCRVIDISILGLGITFHHQRPSELVGRVLHVEVPAVGDSVKVRFEGKIRNAAQTNPEGTVRVGVEFVGLSEAEQALTAYLSAMSRRVTRLSMA
jgi:PilZ domain